MNARDDDDQPVSTIAGPSRLDMILKNPDFGRPIAGMWHWDRYDIDLPIRSITPREQNRFLKDATRQVVTRRGSSSEIDGDKYNYAVIAAGCQDPNFNEPDVRKRIAEAGKNPQFTDVNSAINMTFLPGEIQRLAADILKLSGFSDEETTIADLKGSSSGE